MRKYCYFFLCYEGAVEGKNVKKKKNEKKRDFRLRCVFMLFILAGYLSRTLISFSCQLVAVE